MSAPGAGAALIEAAMAALRPVLGGVYDGPPIQAALPYAVVEAGPERDWSHKSGEGRELRLAVVIRDKGERPERLRTLMAEAEAALRAPGAAEGWELASFRFLAGRIGREREGGWAGTIEYRARMLRTG